MVERRKGAWVEITNTECNGLTLTGKAEIIATRLNGLGSSDAKMVVQVGKTGQLNETAKKRIAQMLGLIEREDVTTYAMQKGNEIEMAIFESIKQVFPNAVSNPYYKNDEFSEKYGFNVFNHIDVEYYNSSFDLNIWVEIKATIDSLDETLNKYLEQLAWHWNIMSAQKKECENRLVLAHYDTSDGDTNFDANKLSFKSINSDILQSNIDFILKGLQIISDAIPNFKYEVSDYESNLPVEIKQFLPQLANFLQLANEYDEKAKELKERLKNAMFENSIKSIDNEFFKCTFVPETVKSNFDSKSFQKEYPDLYAKFLKNSNVQNSIRLTLKN